MEASTENIPKIKREIEADCLQNFGEISLKIRSGLDELNEISGNFRRVLQSLLEQSANHVINKLKTLMDPYAKISYEISSNQYAECEINDPFFVEFSSQFENLVRPFSVKKNFFFFFFQKFKKIFFQTQMREVNYESLLQILLKYILTRMELEISKKKFTQLGGLQLDRELRILQPFFTNLGVKNAREKFSRVNQICALLYIEKLEEVYWNSQESTSGVGLAWRLAPREIRKILTLRGDLNKDEINKLKL